MASRPKITWSICSLTHPLVNTVRLSFSKHNNSEWRLKEQRTCCLKNYEINSKLHLTITRHCLFHFEIKKQRKESQCKLRTDDLKKFSYSSNEISRLGLVLWRPVNIAESRSHCTDFTLTHIEKNRLTGRYKVFLNNLSMLGKRCMLSTVIMAYVPDNRGIILKGWPSEKEED